ncbi:MAG: hypothetical protein JO250_22320 [Armatimonadetes bacterium]|nr:hypothetical protein [Armatimonadota bacterium]
MPRDDEYDDTQDDAQGDYAAGSDYSDGQDGADAHQAMANAAPEEVDAHRGLIDEALGMLQGQGVNPQALANQAGVGTTDADQMSHGDLISMARTLAQQHPEVLQMVASRFPQAQGLLGSVLGGGGGQAQDGGGQGGGMFGGLLGKIFGG